MGALWEAENILHLDLSVVIGHTHMWKVGALTLTDLILSQISM